MSEEQTPWENSIFGQLGFHKERCPHCGAHLHGENATCLNACELPVWHYRIMLAGLQDARRKMDAEEAKKRQLPSLDELYGSDPDFTGDLESVEYLRRNRAGEVGPES